jgi:hypothetical protein
VREVEIESVTPLDAALFGRPVWITGNFTPTKAAPTKVTIAASNVIDPSKPALHYGDHATLHGKFVSRDFPATNGGTENQYVLLADAPFDVTPGPLDPTGGVEQGVKEITLVMASAGNAQWLDKHVTVKGTLFAPSTGHHHTPALMSDVTVTSP